MADEPRKSRRDRGDDTTASGPPPKRELEEAPQLLRKASLILIGGAILPWMTSISTIGKMPWGMWAASVVVTLLAGWVMIEGVKARAGDKANGMVKPIADAHPMGGTIAGLVLFVAAVVLSLMGNAYFGVNSDGIIIQDGAPLYLGQGAENLPEEGYRETFSIRGVLELGTLLLALATFAHILAYEYGVSKFNPVFPLMFLGPAVAGSLHVFTAITQPYSNPLKAIGIVGSGVVGAAGIMAMYTMYVTMKQAKVEGDRKAAEARERRRAERASRTES